MRKVQFWSQTLTTEERRTREIAPSFTSIVPTLTRHQHTHTQSTYQRLRPPTTHRPFALHYHHLRRGKRSEGSERRLHRQTSGLSALRKREFQHKQQFQYRRRYYHHRHSRPRAATHPAPRNTVDSRAAMHQNCGPSTPPFSLLYCDHCSLSAASSHPRQPRR